jgi:hypothetical protein
MVMILTRTRYLYKSQSSTCACSFLRPNTRRSTSYSDACNFYSLRVTDHVPHLHKTDQIYWSNYLLTNSYTLHRDCCRFWCRVLILFIFKGHAIAHAVSGRLPTAATWVGAQVRSGQVIWDVWWTKWHWGRSSPSTSVSLANSHSTNCFTHIIIYHAGLVQ